MTPTFQMRTRITVAGLAIEGDKSPFILQLWVKLATVIGQLPGAGNPQTVYGVWRKEETADGVQHRYLVGVEVGEAAQVPEGIDVWHIHEAECAVFTPQGDMGRIVHSYARIAEWFKGSSRKATKNGYTLEVYDTRQSLDGNYVVEVWEELEQGAGGI